jgi:hypothetical protein
MAEILGLGVTHSPLLIGTDQRMAGILERVMRSPRLPDHLREPVGLAPGDAARMGGASGRPCRARASATLDRRLPYRPRRARGVQSRLHSDLRRRSIRKLPRGWRRRVRRLRVGRDRIAPYSRAGTNNAWSEPADTVIRTKGHPAGGRYVAKALTEQGFDINWAYRMRYENGLPHAFLNALLLLDYDRKGLPWPVVPFHVNCYGSSTISKRGRVRAYRRHRIGRTGSAGPQPVSLFRHWRGDGAGVGRVAVARRDCRLIKLVACVPDREASLSVSRPGV